MGIKEASKEAIIEEATTHVEIPPEIKKLLASKNNIMFHGAAGTGKSTLLKEIVRNYKNAVVLSPTGIAALNVGGQTLHSFFGFSFGYLDSMSVKGCPRKLGILEKKPLLIIDEVSMVRADIFNAIDVSLRKTLYNTLPFAGLQVLLFGDTGQLPPVVNGQESRFFEEEGSEMFFNSKAYSIGNFKHLELTEVYRQKSQNFVTFLHEVRKNNIGSEDLDWFNSKIEILSTEKFFRRNEQDATVLCMTNNRADEYNESMYSKLKSQERTYRAEVTGKFNEAEYPTHDSLRLKIGTKVVLLKNHKQGNYVNGSVGLVTELGEDHVYVNIKGTEQKVEVESWEKYAYVDTRNGIEKQVVGSFKQIPIRLAWAVTVHKSQGMTLSRIHLDMERKPFTHGQMYVALSRARTVKGITSTRPLMKSDIIVDKKKLLKGTNGKQG